MTGPTLWRTDGGIDATTHSPLKLLFICSRNRIRSLTAERIFAGVPGWDVRSAGTQPGARIVVTEGTIRWADVVVAMEKSHLQRLRERFPEALAERAAVVLGIPDEFVLMQPELVHELRAAMELAFEVELE